MQIDHLKTTILHLVTFDIMTPKALSFKIDTCIHLKFGLPTASHYATLIDKTILVFTLTARGSTLVVRI